MSCRKCSNYLTDFLLAGLPRDLPMLKEIKISSLKNVIDEVVPCIIRLWIQIPKADFDEAFLLASNIARRGRGHSEYESVLYMATTNFMCFRVPWLSKEIEYIKIMLIEAGCVRPKYRRNLMNLAREFVCYILTKSIVLLRLVHEDHMNPKGLMTDISTTLPKQHKIQIETLSDTEDYQKEILEEVLLDDLYT
jgi:hypothetical protein